MLDSDSRLNRRQALATLGALTAAPLILGTGATPAGAAAPLLGVWQPKFFRFKLGGFEVTTISDSEFFIDGPYPVIGKNASEDEVRKLMRDNLLPEQKFQPGFTPTIVNTGKEIVLFDTGNGANGFVARPNGGWLAAQLAPAGFKPEDVDVVVLTHGHPDHAGGLIEGGRPLFPNARYVISAAEYDFWSPKNKLPDALEKLAGTFRANTPQIADKFKFLKPGDDVTSGIRSVDAPGHTPGHLAFLIESEGRQALIWGDCAHHHVASLAHPEWFCVFDTDQEKAAETRKRIFDMVATDRLPVFAYHMPFPSVGFVERISPASYRWLAHSYQFNL